ncbi:MULTISPECIES: two-component system sensor histidine kinase PmrB [unclassified Pantoea]|uniref:two-component system sensor histidine kinase PmrB n=1 Tax=unclassified Pantoea TaxID=2630326 RepID=UPI001CD58AED|nr:MULTISPECIES: two-component system sensor histidine kinase PmrB [unclassified Pantoea]MCA1176938.1 two-component system sensor histidine kinase PmrB [Pantoea sp. alder69]MCA1252183.1 two-component system sensor histidine kinase PmrB [Pantoea sp. alder70]MCA1265461.1 two-component system sensor histidine kinase PmrB [Pantoea sp. alder81]
MNSMRQRLLIMLALILLTCQVMSAIWLWHESREQISFLVNETLSAQARNDRVENEIREAIASLLLPSLVMIALTLLLSFWAINWIIRPLRSLQDSLAHRSADNLTPLPVYSEMDEIVAVTSSINQLFSRLDHTLQQERLFTADAAHELRTPLAGLRLHLELLHQQQVPQSEMLIERIDQLMHTVEQLLMLSRAGQALAGGHYQQLLWQQDIMQPLQPEMAELYEQRQQTLHWPHGKDIPQQGEAVLLRLMLRNLLENASRYSPEGSEVKVRMQQDKQQVIIEVWDQGPGIEADAAEELTQAFRRRDQRYGGSGLGLNIVLRIVQMHRGRLELVNREDSSGLIARCYLPHQLL